MVHISLHPWHSLALCPLLSPDSNTCGARAAIILDKVANLSRLDTGAPTGGGERPAAKDLLHGSGEEGSIRTDTAEGSRAVITLPDVEGVEEGGAIHARAGWLAGG